MRVRSAGCGSWCTVFALVGCMLKPIGAAAQSPASGENGLASISEVAETQRLLAQAEADDAVARLGVWRGLLATAQAYGDLAPFLEPVRR
jgi:hypothetical protein